MQAASAVIEAVGDVEGVKPEDITTQDISVSPQVGICSKGSVLTNKLSAPHALPIPDLQQHL